MQKVFLFTMYQISGEQNLALEHIGLQFQGAILEAEQKTLYLLNQIDLKVDLQLRKFLETCLITFFFFLFLFFLIFQSFNFLNKNSLTPPAPFYSFMAWSSPYSVTFLLFLIALFTALPFFLYFSILSSPFQEKLLLFLKLLSISGSYSGHLIRQHSCGLSVSLVIFWLSILSLPATTTTLGLDNPLTCNVVFTTNSVKGILQLSCVFDLLIDVKEVFSELFIDTSRSLPKVVLINLDSGANI